MSHFTESLTLGKAILLLIILAALFALSMWALSRRLSREIRDGWRCHELLHHSPLYVLTVGDFSGTPEISRALDRPSLDGVSEILRGTPKRAAAPTPEEFADALDALAPGPRGWISLSSFRPSAGYER